jgi:uncharacterized protein (DUF305 family)
MRKIGLLVTLMTIILLAPGANATGSKIGSSEIAFAQEMIPHHEQAVTMANLASKYSRNNNVLAIAKMIRAEQTPEITQMQSWLSRAGIKLRPTLTMNGMDMGMNGMLNPRQLALLGAARNGAFDRLFLLAMIGHHKGAIQMAGQIATSKFPEAIILHKNIIKVQSSEITQMKKLLAAL